MLGQRRADRHKDRRLGPHELLSLLMAGGGIVARGGFEFQDLVLSIRVVEHLSARLLAQSTGSPEPTEPTFYVEGRPTSPIDAPDWDVVERRPSDGRLVFEEAKGGAVSREDRIVFWLRLRATAETYGAGDLVARLTINRDEPPTGIEHFRGLQAAVPGVQRPTKNPPGNVTSSKKLAAEALYWLTRPQSKGAPTKAMKEQDARALLGTFDLFESPGRVELRTTLDARLSALTRDVATPLLVNVVHGELARRAASTVKAERQFKPSDVLVQIEALATLSRASREAQKLFADLYAHRAEPLGAIDPTSPLAYQNWRDVQPDVARVVDDALTRRIAVVGRGGIGKSILLEHLGADARAQGALCILAEGSMFRGVTSDTLAEAFAIGRFVAAQQGRTLLVVVDAIETAADSPSALAAIVAGLTRAPPDVRIVAGARATEWETLSGVMGWRLAPMLDWGLDRVRGYVLSAARPSVSDELLRLLTTPLFLDLFLRIFGTAETVPAGLQTRHGLLAEYWSRRVLPDNSAVASSRRRVLDRAAEEECAGHELHQLPDGAPTEQLLSEGVLRSRRGLFSFRHALLRDFAVMDWLLFGSTLSSGDAVAARIELIPRTLPKMGAVRATVEAATEVAPKHAIPFPASEVLHALALNDSLRDIMAEILADLDDPSTTDLSALLGALGRSAAEFLERLVSVVRLKGARAWGPILARLPTRDSFATAAVVYALADLAETLGDNTESALLATSLRTWADLPALQGALDANEGWGRARVIDVVAKRAPNDATFDWLERQPRTTWRVRAATLDALPRVVRASSSITDTRVRELYVDAANLVNDRGRMSPRDEDGLWSHHAITGALLGTEKEPGLLRGRLTAVLPTVLAMLAARSPTWAAEEADDESFEDFLMRHGRPDLDAADRALFSALPQPLTPRQAFGDLAFDVENAIGLRHDSVWGPVVGYLRIVVKTGTVAEVHAFASSARDSVSMLARLTVLRGATERLGEQGFDAIIDELLDDGRLYFFSSAAFDLHRALAARWQSWDEPVRVKMLERIRAVLQRPSVTRIYDVAPLVVAIPQGEWPQDLRAHVESHQRRFGNPTPSDPLRPQQPVKVRGVPFDELFDRGLRPGTLPEPERIIWREVERALTAISKPEGTPESLITAIDLAIPALPQSNTPPAATVWCAGRLATAIESLSERGSPPDASTLARLFDWVLMRLGQIDPVQLNSDRMPVEPGIMVAAGASPFEALLWLGSAIFVAGGLTDSRRFWKAVDRVIGSDPAPKVARAVFTHVHVGLWDTAEGAACFTRVSAQLRDGQALAWGVPIATKLPTAALLALYDRWLAGLPAVVPPETRLADRLGEQLGVASAEPLVAYRRKLLARCPRQGLTAVAIAYRHLLGGMVMGCALALEEAVDPIPWVALASELWSAVARTKPQPSERAPHFALRIFRWMSEVPTRTPTLWPNMEPLAISIVDKGRLDEVGDLLFNLLGGPLFKTVPATSFVALGRALVKRLSKTPRLSDEERVTVPERASEFLGRLGSTDQVSEPAREEFLLALREWSTRGRLWTRAMREMLRVRASFE